MTKYAEMRKECLASGYIIQEAGVDVCGVNKSRKCSGYACPSKHYWNSGKSQEGYHKMKALEATGLTEQYNEEIVASEESPS